MNKKLAVVAIMFMFFVCTCASFANINVEAPKEVAQRHHHRHHGDRPDYRRYKRICPPHCKCVRDGFCRPGECSVKCRCPHCKVVPRHRVHSDSPHHPRHHHRY